MQGLKEASTPFFIGSPVNHQHHHHNMNQHSYQSLSHNIMGMTAAFGNFNVNEMNMDINMDLNGTRAKQISKTSPQVMKFEN